MRVLSAYAPFRSRLHGPWASMQVSLTGEKQVTRQLQVFWYAHISECGGLHDRKIFERTRSCTMLGSWEGKMERWQRQTKKEGLPPPPPFFHVPFHFFVLF